MSPSGADAGSSAAVAAGKARAPTLDRDNPWPGLGSYDESARLYFNGRGEEITELARRVLDEPLTVLFGRSGLGKSSLLRAGLFPLLREKGFVPIYVRLHLHAAAAPLCVQVRAFLEDELRANSIECPEWPEDESLWQYLHRTDFELWTTSNRLVRPVLVFDQFEEVFTLGRQMPAEIERFRTELADLIENRVPASLRQRLEGKGAKELGLDLQSMPCKLVLSLREDFLADLETWRASIPSLRRNRMRLLPMRAGNALRAIHNEHTAHLVDEANAREIVSFLAARSASEGEAGSTAGGETTSAGASDDSEIDPALLSLFCAGVNARRQRTGASRIDASLIDAAKRTVVADFYRECVADQPPKTRAFIEDELVTENGFRNSYSVDEAIARDYLSEPQLDTLVNRRLLRRTHLLGTDRIELTHDLLTKAVVQERGTRLKLEREAQRRKDRRRVQIWIAGAVTTVLLAIGVTVWGQRLRVEAEEQRQQALSRQLAAMATKEIGRDHELATWFALLAVSFGETAESREALVDTALYSWPYAKITGAEQFGGNPIAIAVSSDGTYLAALAEAASSAAVTLWNISTPTPTRVWLRPVAIERPKLLVLSRDAKQIAVGGGNAIDLLDAADGSCVRRLTAPADIVAMIFGRDARLAWSDDQAVHLVHLGAAKVGAPSGAADCGKLATDGTPLTFESLAIKGVGEVAFDSRGNLLLAVVDGQQFGVLRTARNAAGALEGGEPLPLECEGERSISLGASRYSTTISQVACAFAIDDKSGKVVPDDDFERPSSRRDSVIRDVVWSRVGVSNIKVLGDGELKVSGPKLGNRWTTHLKGVDFVSDSTLNEELALSTNGLRLAALGRNGATVTVYNLEPRPFLAELVKDSFAVAPDARWLAMGQQRAWRRTDSKIDIFERREDATYARAQTIELAGIPTAMLATGEALLVSLRSASDPQGAVTERRDVARPESAAWSVPGSLVSTAGARGEWLILQRVETSASGGSAPSYLAVRTADGGGEVLLGKGAAPLVAANGRFVAALPNGGQDKNVDVDVMRVDGTSISLIGKAFGVSGPAWQRLRLGDEGLSLSDGVRDFPVTVDPAERPVSATASASTDAASAFASSKAAGLRSLRSLRSGGGCEVRFTPTRDGESSGKHVVEVVDTAPGLPARRPGMSTREGVEVAHTNKWLVMWDSDRVDVFDLENCRDFGRYEISGVEEVGFEGGGTILRLDMAKHSMLLPLERAITEGLARSLLNRKYTTEDRCKYIGIDCDKVDLSARAAAQSAAAR